MKKILFFIRSKKIQYGLLLTLIFFGLFYGSFLFFKVRQVEVNGIGSLNGTTLVKNKLIFLVSPESVSKQLLKLNPDIATVVVSKHLPATIIFDVQKDSVVGALEVANGYYLLSKNGKIIRKIREIETGSQFPVISFYQKFDYNENPVGTVINQEEIVAGLFFLTEVEDLGAHIVKLDITGTDMLVLKTDDDVRFLFTTIRPKYDQMQEFKVLYKKFRIEKTHITTIDFRFDKPVVKF